MTKPQGSITTPNWPNKNYPSGISCSWLITVDPDKVRTLNRTQFKKFLRSCVLNHAPFQVIEVKFDKFDVEQDMYCRFDYVAFYNGGETDASRRIGKYCGDKAPE